ncbi:hypothetical protein Leryth_023329 [Lithospermum erythrorhizon]|nr:hypothetical protein Leryth_023329 [Lithospermum erythrorhizon]
MVDHLQKKPHSILVSYPLQGHVIPSVQLAIKLASSGFTITFINTQSIHHQITSKSQQSGHQEEDIFAEARRASPGLDIRYITVSDGLPVDFDRSLNHDQFMASLLHVFSAHVEEVVLKIILENKPNVSCLIADTFFVWPGHLAKKYGLLYISFWTEPALVFTLYYHMDLLRSNGHFGFIDAREDSIDYIPGLPRIEPKDLMSYLQTPEVSVTHQIIFKAFRDVKNADMVLCNTVEELEPQVISSIQKRVPFYAIGPLFPTSDFTSNNNVAMSLWAESDCSRWLDYQEQGSVLYVSFGSYAHVRKIDLLKIANGLALSNVKFVWVMRPDIVDSDDADPLPDEFKKGTQDRGIIIPWCNQKQVISHPAIGGFLTHCGWNSILESIWCQLPMLCFPLLTDQFTNRKLVVDDWKIGVDLCVVKNLVTPNEVAKNVNYLMTEESSRELRNAVKEIKNILDKAIENGGSSWCNTTKYIKDLRLILENKNKRNLNV